MFGHVPVDVVVHPHQAQVELALVQLQRRVAVVVDDQELQPRAQRWAELLPQGQLPVHRLLGVVDMGDQGQVGHGGSLTRCG